MRQIVYYVAASLDGFISGPNEDVSQFIYTGKGIDKYIADLQDFDTVIMGRTTYDFGYKFGVAPGQPSPTYPHMKHYIFFDHLSFEQHHPQVEVKKMDITEIDRLREEEGGAIYLCGGGQFAGWLLENKKIDRLKIKLNPVLLGDGLRLFGNSSASYKLQLQTAHTYEDGLQILEYSLLY
jgi:dihydrofolate reductase